MDSPRNRIALVTGGSRGIGSAIAAELKTMGFSVVAPSRSELDLKDPASVEAFLEKNKSLEVDILVNNAGINVIKPIAAVDRQTLESMQQVNLSAPLRLIQAFAPGMSSRGWGRILNISSVFSLVTKEKRVTYSMTKAALNALTRSVAVEFGAGGVLANALAPGYVETDLTYQNNSAADIASIKQSIPMQRLAKPTELAKVAGFLCSEENTYLTGQTIVVDGGFACL